MVLALTYTDGLCNVVLPYTFSSGGTVQSAQINADFTAVASEINTHEAATNPHNTTLAQILSTANSCGSTSINFNGQQALDMAVENKTTDPSPGLAGRLFFNTTTGLLKVDTGSSIVSVAGTGVNNLSSVLNSGNTTGGTNIDMQESQLLHARVENLISDPSAGNAGRLYFLTGTSTLKVDTGSSIVAIGGSQGLSSVLGISNSAGSTNLDLNGNQLLHVILDKQSSDPGTNLTGNIYYNTASNVPRFYNGSSWASIGNTNTLAQTVALGNTTGGDIDFGSHKALNMVLFNSNGSPGTGTGGFVWYDTGTSTLNYETSSVNHAVCSLDQSQTLTNKTISGSSNTLTNIQDSSLSTNVDLLASNQSITGTKTFSTAPVISTVKSVAGDVIALPSGGGSDTFALLNKTQTLQATTLNAPTFLNNTDFSEGIAAHFRVENVTSDPSPGYSGRLFYKSTTGELKYDDGTNLHVLTANNLGTSSFTNVAISGTLDVVGAATFEGNAAVNGTLSLGNPLAVTSGGTGLGSISANQLLYSSGANIYTGLTTANSSTLSTNASGVPAWRNALPNGVQSNITSLGTISSGLWNGTTIGVLFGGTGLSSTIANQLLFSSANNVITGLTTGNNGTLITSSSGLPSISSTLPSAVQGNITSLGTLSSLTVANGTSTNTLNIGTVGSQKILYASGSDGTINGLTTANSGTLITSATGVPSISSTLPSAVQTNITSLGTVTTGVWNGTSVAVGSGGTGLISGVSGGMPYYNSTSTMLSSPLLTQYGLLMGGGSGAGPQNIPSGLGNSGSVMTSNGAGTPPSWQSSPTATGASCEVTRDHGGGTGSVWTSYLKFSTNGKSTGSCLSFTTTSPTVGESVVVATAGLYTISFFCGDNSGTTSFAAIVNGTSGTGNNRLFNYASGLRCIFGDPGSTRSSGCSWTGRLSVNDYINFMTNAGPSTVLGNDCGYTITQIVN